MSIKCFFFLQNDTFALSVLGNIPISQSFNLKRVING